MENVKEELEKLSKDKITIKNENITIIGKYHKNNNENFLGELICQTLPSITLVNGDKLLKTKLIDGNFYKVIGILNLYPDIYSDKAKFYLQLKVQNVYEITKDNPDDLKEYLEAKNKIEKIIGERKKEELLTEKKIIETLGQYKKINFLYIVSEKGDKGNSDILNDLYTSNSQDETIEKKQRNRLSKYFGIDFKEEKNILRTRFSKDEWQNTLIKIKEELNSKNYSAIVFIKGGGSTTSFFDDELFCLSILELKIPIITAVGHSKDDKRLLCQLADINYKTPSYLGQNFIRLTYANFYSSQNKKLEDKEKEISKLQQDKEQLNKEIEFLISNNKIYKEKIESLNLKNHSLEEDIKSLKRKVKLKNILLLFLIPLVILFNMIYLYFSNPKKEITKQETVKEEIKKDIQPLKEEKSNLIEKVQEKISEKAEEKKVIKEDKKEIPKVEKKKRLVYSEDDVYTVLLWKGYKGEKAINNFQRDNGMKVTGKVDEALLKKLGVKYRFE